MERSTEPTGSLHDLTPSLVTRLRNGDRDAAALLENLYRDALIRFCWGYLANMDEAEDAVQDVCCQVLEVRDIPDRFRPWLYRTARNHCLNLLRARVRRKDGQVLPAESRVDAALTGHLTGMARAELRGRLAELVAALSDAQREVLRLRYVEDLSRTEIAEVLEESESVIKSRLFEGLKRLRHLAPELGEE